MRQSERSLVEICEHAREIGIRVAVENPCPNEVYDNPEDLRSTVDRFDEDLVGICFDTSHANILRNAPDTAEIFRGRIISVHLSDNHGLDDDHLMPFAGSIKWKRLLAALIDGGFSGPWLFEVFSFGVDPFDLLKKAGRTAAKMRRLLQKLA
jgi:sugar phosphate isomerase/epimerase